MQPVDDLIAILTEKGGALYGREAVTQLEHALQSAQQAEDSGADAPLIAAALLHDIGHLIDPDFMTERDEAEDLHHEQLAAQYLRRWFPDSVTEPIRLHVAAKRYLCATERGYFEDLSAASVRSLKLQGGPYSPEDARTFAAKAHAAEAIALRRWDDLAKVPGKETPDLTHYRPILEASLVADPAKA